MERLIESIEKQLRDSVPVKRLGGRDKLLGKSYNSLGIPLKQIRKTIPEIYRESEKTSYEDCVGVVDNLLARNLYEEKISAIFLLGELIRDGQVVDFPFLKRLIDSYIDEWSLCDTFATDVVAPSLLMDWDTGQKIVMGWSDSRNEWVRRCALVGTIKCKDKVPGWEEFSRTLLGRFKDEEEKIVKKAAIWLKRQLGS